MQAGSGTPEACPTRTYGKTRTVTAEGTDAKGNKVTSTAVYDKQ